MHVMVCDREDVVQNPSQGTPKNLKFIQVGDAAAVNMKPVFHGKKQRVVWPAAMTGFNRAGYGVLSAT